MIACSIDGCSGNAVARGWCETHYRRWKRNGDPTFSVRAQARPGELRRFYRAVVLPYEGDECLSWPFGCLSSGYAKMGNSVVSRLVCEDEHGPPPTPEHQAAHSCGRGHLGCVARKHMSWKTPKENQRDQLQHGTVMCGARNPNAKLSESEVFEIRRLHGSGVSTRRLCDQFGVSNQTISSIMTGRTWPVKETA